MTTNKLDEHTKVQKKSRKKVNIEWWRSKSTLFTKKKNKKQTNHSNKAVLSKLKTKNTLKNEMQKFSILETGNFNILETAEKKANEKD